MSASRLVRVGRFLTVGSTYLALMLPALLGISIKRDRDRYGEPTLGWSEGLWEVLFVTVLYAFGIVALAAYARRRLEKARDDDQRLRVVCTGGGALVGAFLVSLPMLHDALEDAESRIVLLFVPVGFAVFQGVGASIGGILGGLPWLFGSRRHGGR